MARFRAGILFPNLAVSAHIRHRRLTYDNVGYRLNFSAHIRCKQKFAINRKFAILFHESRLTSDKPQHAAIGSHGNIFKPNVMGVTEISRNNLCIVCDGRSTDILLIIYFENGAIHLLKASFEWKTCRASPNPRREHTQKCTSLASK